MDVFFETLFESTKNLFIILNKKAPMKKLTEEELHRFNNSNICHICEQEIIYPELKVMDHDHITGRFRNQSHVLCNSLYSLPKQIPCIVHNLKNFDSNLIIKELSNRFFKKIKVLPKTSDKFISFSLDNIKFLDSFAFLSSSLDCLAENLKKSGLQNFKITRNVLEKNYGKIDENLLDKIIGKTSFPYEFFTSFDKFNIVEFPKYKHFYSHLKFSNIEYDKYLNAKFLYKYFKCSNLGDFQNLYVLLDSAILADIFTSFRKNTLKIYGLDPCYYYSIPSLSWNAMLKFTKVEIELFKEIDMYLFIEQNLRGGISQVSKRYVTAENEMIGNKSSENSNYLVYYDGKVE